MEPRLNKLSAGYGHPDLLTYLMNPNIVWVKSCSVSGTNCPTEL